MTAPQPAEDGHPQEKRMNPRRLRQTMYWLALDWIHLRTTTPTLPVQRLQDISRSSNVKTYGHPAEWQSDNAADIVEKLTGWHDYLADQRNETAPPTGCESRRLVAAWKYLEPRCEQLTELVEHEALKELPDLHHRIRRTLGHTAPKYTLPVPCPNSECGLRTLIRVVGIGQDFISCDACGYTIKEVHYPFLIRMTLDAFISTHSDTNTDQVC